MTSAHENSATSPHPLPFELGEPRTLGRLTVLPLFPADQPTVEYVGLDEVFARGLIVTEVDEAGAVEALRLENPLDERVLLGSFSDAKATAGRCSGDDFSVEVRDAGGDRRPAVVAVSFGGGLLAAALPARPGEVSPGNERTPFRRWHRQRRRSRRDTSRRLSVPIKGRSRG